MGTLDTNSTHQLFVSRGANRAPEKSNSFNLGEPVKPREKQEIKNNIQRNKSSAALLTSVPLNKRTKKDQLAYRKQLHQQYRSRAIKNRLNIQNHASQGAFGSTNATSDNDYTMDSTDKTTTLRKGGRIQINVMSNKVTNILKGWDVKDDACSNSDRDPFSTIGKDSITQTTKFKPTKREKAALDALKRSKFNWFGLLQITQKAVNDGRMTTEKRNELLFDVRRLEKNITTMFQEQINTAYESITEGENVRIMNQLYSSAFGSEAGQVFDTNFYTNGVILEKGFKLEGQEADKWKESMDINSKIKMAQQFIHEAHGDIGQAKDAFEAFVTNQTNYLNNENKSTQVARFNKAFTKATERQLNIQTEINKNTQKTRDVGGIHIKLTRSEKELAAMNRLYEKKLGAIDEKREQISNLEKKITETTTTNDDLKEELNTLKREAIDMQSEALLYANEPYYSQATIVHVVAGMQMGKTAEDYPVLADTSCAFNSAEENFGDLKKCLLEYPIGDKFPGDKHLLKSSKYAKRALDSLKTSLKNKNVSNEFKSKLKQMSESIDKIYAKKQGKSKDTTANSTLIQNAHFNPTATNPAMSPNDIALEFHSHMMDILAESRQYM